MSAHGVGTGAALVLLASVAVSGCWRLGVGVRENDASGYEDLGVPVIEAIEYTPAGREVRVALERPGYLTVLVVDPERSVSVRFARGETRSRRADSARVRLPLDRLESPLRGIPIGALPAIAQRPTRRPVLSPGSNAVVRQQSPFDARDVSLAAADSGGSAIAAEQRLRSMRVTNAGQLVTRAHVVVLQTEQPLDLIRVAMRIAAAPADPARVAQAAAGDGSEGGRWIAATAPLP
ncbi:MAG: hypothetical protein MUF21_10460 [Gemmatimonadaceae bacterium]|nr:hypothetical protein [Gemmatimonadaceae bacterium]